MRQTRPPGVALPPILLLLLLLLPTVRPRAELQRPPPLLLQCRQVYSMCKRPGSHCRASSSWMRVAPQCVGAS